MKTFTGIFLLALFLGVALTPLVRLLALRVGAVDRPGRRKVHRGTIPRLGGIAIYLAAFLPLLSFLFLDNRLTGIMHEALPQILGLWVGATVILVVGICDDIWGWSAWVKLPLQIVAAIPLYVVGFEVSAVTNPFGAPIELGVAGPVITILWIVGVANAINLIDGIDGLAAGITGFAAIAIFICSLVLGHEVIGVLVIGLAGAILGFLHHNFYPARIFMGDSGSLFVGFTLAALSLLGALEGATVVALAIPTLIFGLPLADTFLAAGRRFFRGDPIFKGDDEHVHHRLLQQGFSQRQSSLILYVVTAFLGTVAILLTSLRTRTIGIGFLVVGILGLVVFRQLLLVRSRWLLGREPAETLRRARRVLFEAGEALRVAGDEADVWEALRRAAEALGYEGAKWVHASGDGEPTERRWGDEAEDSREWDLSIPLPVGEGDVSFHVNRIAGTTIDFATRDTILTLLGDLAAERLEASRRAAGESPASGPGPRPGEPSGLEGVRGEV